MLCEHCGKSKKVTFHRVGGEIEESRFKKKVPKEGPRVRSWNAVCLSCIEKRMKSDLFIQAAVLKNPTLASTGDPAEWILNE